MAVYDRIKAPIDNGGASDFIYISATGSEGFRSPNAIVSTGTDELVSYLIEANGQWEIGSGSLINTNGYFYRRYVLLNSLGTTDHIDSTGGEISFVLTAGEMANYFSSSATASFDKSYIESFTKRSNVSGTLGFNPIEHGNVQSIRPNGNITLNGYDEGLPTGMSVVMVIDMRFGSYIVTFNGGGLTFIGGEAPTFSEGSKHVIVLFNAQDDPYFRYTVAYVGRLS